MNDTAQHGFDLYRIFVGEQPLIFLLEILFRTIVMYLYVLLLLRLLGKRGMGQLSPFEFTIIIALGSAVGDPMFYPDVPLLHCIAVVTLVVGATRLLASLANKSEEVERFMEGQPCCFVREGRLDLDVIDQERFSREELFMLLREKGVSQLGQVRRAYLEPSGTVSVFRWPEERARPGLPIIPPYDELAAPLRLSVRGMSRRGGALYACWRCGHSEPAANAPCSYCGNDEWTVATRDPLDDATLQLPHSDGAQGDMAVASSAP
jgi:uncharacterized membrane protein YcaP (DUF421 family)